MTQILDIEFEDETLQECVRIYNEIADTQYPDILEYTHMDLYIASHKRISPTIWKKFLLNEKILDWYDEERRIQINNKANKMIKKLGDTNSTAQVQGLNTLLAQINRQSDEKESNEIIVYNFIPLNPEEGKNPNVNILKNVPNQIRNAIQTINKSYKK